MYWSDWETFQVYSADKYNGLNQTTVVHVPHLMSVRAYHALSQPASPNKCEYAGCEHLCLPVEHQMLSGHEQPVAIPRNRYS